LNLGVSNEATLQLVEQTQYQTLMHLMLKLRLANDETLKRHLASRLKDATHLTTSLTQRVSQLEDAYQRAQQSNEQIMQDNQALHEEKRRMVD